MHPGDHRLDFIGQRSAIGVAEHDAVCAAFHSRRQGGQGITRVCLVAVKKMLGVINDFPGMVFQICHRIMDHGQIFFPT